MAWKVGGSAMESDIVPAADLAVGRRWNGDLMAIDRQTGERVWMVQPSDYTFRYRSDQSPAARGDTIFFGGVDGGVHAVDGRTGAAIWTFDTGDAITSSVVIAGNDLYAGLANRQFLRIDTTSGELLGSVQLEEPAMGRPAVADDAVLVMIGRGHLVAYARDLGAELWRQDGDPRWTSPQPLVWQGLVIVGTQIGMVHAFATGSGEQTFTLTLDGRVRGLGAHEDVIYVGTMNGNLFACRPELE